MKEEIKQIWIDALTSGKYKQGTRVLRWADEFCCLGVLCDLFQQETGKGKWVTDDFGGTKFLNENKVLPKEVQEWASIDNVGGYELTMRSPALTTDNDDGKTFNQLAEIIFDHF